MLTVARLPGSLVVACPAAGGDEAPGQCRSQGAGRVAQHVSVSTCIPGPLGFLCLPVCSKHEASCIQLVLAAGLPVSGH